MYNINKKALIVVPNDVLHSLHCQSLHNWFVSQTKNETSYIYYVVRNTQAGKLFVSPILATVLLVIICNIITFFCLFFEVLINTLLNAQLAGLEVVILWENGFI